VSLIEIPRKLHQHSHKAGPTFPDRHGRLWRRPHSASNLYDTECVVNTAFGELYAAGNNKDGKLGLGLGNSEMKSTSVPRRVEGLAHVRLAQIAAGWGHSVALDGNLNGPQVLDRGRVYAWGYGKKGALGLGSTENQVSPQRLECFERPHESIRTIACGSHHTGFITVEGKLYMCGANHVGQLGWKPHDIQSTPLAVQAISERVSQVACGVLHSLMLTGIA
jgi:E3 ubiquitin-protein ligase HERC4